jgi:CheY-like chemotaxis protein
VLRILYVEDNEDNAYMLKMQLELTDEFEVLVAEDGEKDARLRLLSAGPYSDGPADADRRRLGGYTALERASPRRETCLSSACRPRGSGRKSKFSVPARAGRSTRPSHLLLFSRTARQLLVGGDPLFERRQ